MASAIYIDRDATAFAYRDAAQRALTEAGYEWTPPFLGASAQTAKSQFDRELRRLVLSADVVVLRFGAAQLEDHWAFEELGRIQEYGRIWWPSLRNRTDLRRAGSTHGF